MINTQFTIPAPRLTEEVEAKLREIGLQWVIVGKRGALLLIDSIGSQEVVDAALTELGSQGKAAKIIGEWMPDGKRSSRRPNVDAVEFKKARSEKRNEQGNALPDPDGFEDIHRWAGWEEKE